MRTGRVRRCAALAAKLTFHERKALLEAIRAQQPNLLGLGEDVLRTICRFLDVHDRVAFLRAVTPDLPRFECVHRALPVLSSMLILEVAMRDLGAAIAVLAERTLYALPQNQNVSAFVACNWSPFATRPLVPLATIGWAHRYPHARVDHVRSTMRRLVAANLGRKSPVLRLTVHPTLHMHQPGVPVRVRGWTYRIPLAPMLVQEVFLLWNLVGSARLLERNSCLRHLVATGCKT